MAVFYFRGLTLAVYILQYVICYDVTPISITHVHRNRARNLGPRRVELAKKPLYEDGGYGHNAG